MLGRNRGSRSRLPVALIALTALGLTACAGGGAGSEATPQDVSTTITSDPVTLTVAYIDDPPVPALYEGFTKKYPNVTIEGRQTAFSDYVKATKLTMSSDTPPDIAEYNPGAMRPLIPAGLVMDLGPYAEAYGWEDQFPPASLEVLSSDKSAKQYGTGNLYAVPGAMSVLGVYYNKDLLKQAGITKPPATLAEFEANLQTVKEAGTTPLSVGALQAGGFQLWNALVNVLGNADDYRAWVYGEPGATIETTGATEATKKLADWADQGYIPSSADATADSDAQADFANGKSAFWVSGNWAATDLEKELDDNVGFFLMPGKTPDSESVASGSSVAFSISSKTEHPDVAAAFLDYMNSPEAAQIQFETGFMPVNNEAEISKEGLRGVIADSFENVISHDGIVPFPDYASPGMINKLISGVQGVNGGHMSEEDFLKSLQNEWTKYHG